MTLIKQEKLVFMLDILYIWECFYKIVYGGMGNRGSKDVKFWVSASGNNRKRTALKPDINLGGNFIHLLSNMTLGSSQNAYILADNQINYLSNEKLAPTLRIIFLCLWKKKNDWEPGCIYYMYIKASVSLLVKIKC